MDYDAHRPCARLYLHFHLPAYGGNDHVRHYVSLFLKFPANFEVTLRAASHIVFVLLAILLLKAGFGKKNIFQTVGFAVVISAVHALAEMLVIGVYLYLGIITNSNALYYLLVAVGLGSFVHSLIDFAIAFTIYKTLQKARLIK